MNYISQLGNTPFHIASKYITSQEIIRYMIDNKSDFNVKNNDGFTPCLSMCMNENINVDIIKYLIERRIDINKNDNVAQYTYIHAACQNKNSSLELVKYLVEKKGSINQKQKEGWTPLHLACENKNLSYAIVKYLVEQKSDVNSKQKEGWTPLHFVCENKGITLEIVKFLVEKKSNINSAQSNLWTPLHIACENSSAPLEVINYLIENKSKINAKQKDDFTPLHIVCDNKQLKPTLIHHLVSKKANVNTKTKSCHSTPLHLLCRNKCDLEIIKFLVDKKGSLDSKDCYKYRPFHTFCRYSNFDVSKQNSMLDVIKYLCKDKKSTITSTVDFKLTPLHLVCMNASTTKETIQYLLDKNADINAQTINLETPLYIALANKIPLDCIQLLVEKKSDLNVLNYYGKTLLTSFFLNKSLDPLILKFLLQSGVPLFSNKQRKEIPLRVSKKFSDEIFFVLFSYQKFYFHCLTFKIPPHIFSAYEDGSFWNPSSHQFFVRDFQERIYYLLLNFKFVQRKFLVRRNIFPKPIVFKIIQHSLVPNRKERNWIKFVD